jgi:hypothetical protein
MFVAGRGLELEKSMEKLALSDPGVLLSGDFLLI